MGAERGKKGNKFKIFLLYRFVLSYTLIAKQLEFENDNGKSATTLFSLKMHLDSALECGKFSINLHLVAGEMLSH